MKYLIIAGLCLAGIILISVRDTDLKEIAELPMGIVSTNQGMDKLESTPSMDTKFETYWYAGQAELSGYDLKQSRYGEIHEGTATMIFVTEPFSRKKQVKLDNPGAAGKDNVPVLKLNFTRKFLTGIYPYSMMTSVFSPVNTSSLENALKLTLSGQEWCGQVYMQMNKEGSKYDVKSFSYFESEGDENFKASGSYLEDELYSTIRLNPDLLPTGKIDVIPSAVVQRFLHDKFGSYSATATLEDITWNDTAVRRYRLEYEGSGRILSIYFGASFPHYIEGWEDTYKGFGREALTSTAIRKNTKMLDYWNKHNNEDRDLNAELYK